MNPIAHRLHLRQASVFVLPGIFVRIPACLFFYSKWALGAHFFICVVHMNMLELLDKTLPGLGYELVDAEIGRDGLVRVFIDKQGGIGIDDCVSVSDHLTRLFLVENIGYERLEVSSPGLDRPLKKAADYERFQGQSARFQLRLPINGSRKFQAVIGALKGNVLTVVMDGSQSLDIDLANIDKARLVPQIKFR